MRAYCDTSLLADLLLDESASQDARAVLSHWQARGEVVTSRLTAVELGRLVIREGRVSPGTRLNVGSLPLQFVALDEQVLRRATVLPVQFLKSLDAIHLASALITRCDVVLTRDRQMARACAELDLAVG